MEKYKRYYGIAIFLISLVVLITGAYKLLTPKFEELSTVNGDIEAKQHTFESKTKEKQIVENKIKKIQNSVASSQKKIYSPLESDLGNDTLFFTLYNDLIEMVHANSVKIKTMDYTYNPQTDKFVEFGKDVYFVCDINMDLISNYVNLGKLIQDIYQYPYYIKINQLDVVPYEKDKTILLSKLSLRLYAHTLPESEQDGIIPMTEEKPSDDTQTKQ